MALSSICDGEVPIAIHPNRGRIGICFDNDMTQSLPKTCKAPFCKDLSSSYQQPGRLMRSLCARETIQICRVCLDWTLPKAGMNRNLVQKTTERRYLCHDDRPQFVDGLTLRVNRSRSQSRCTTKRSWIVGTKNHVRSWRSATHMLAPAGFPWLPLSLRRN